METLLSRYCPYCISKRESPEKEREDSLDVDQWNFSPICVFKWQVIVGCRPMKLFSTVCFQMTSASLDVNQWWKEKSRLWSTFFHCVFSSVSFNGCGVCNTFRWIENSLVLKRWNSFQKMGSTTTVWMLTNDEKWNLWCQNNLRKHEPFILHWKKRAKY